MQEYTAITKQDGAWWIGWVEEIPGVNGQESTEEALMESLRITLREAIAMNREDALKAASNNYSEKPLAV